MRLLVLIVLLPLSTVQAQTPPLTLAVLPAAADESGGDAALCCLGISAAASLYAAVRDCDGQTMEDTDMKVAVGIAAVAGVVGVIGCIMDGKRSLPSTLLASQRARQPVAIPRWQLRAGEAHPIEPAVLALPALDLPIPWQPDRAMQHRLVETGRALGADLLLFSWLHPGQQGVGLGTRTEAMALARLEIAVLDTRTGTWLPLNPASALGPTFRLTLPLTEVMASGGPQHVIARAFALTMAAR